MKQPGMENKVMHASFRIGETILMGSDGRCDGQPRFDGFSLSIVVPDEEKAESIFNALADGGKITMPLEKTSWAPRFGMQPVRRRLDGVGSARIVTFAVAPNAFEAVLGGEILGSARFWGNNRG